MSLGKQIAKIKERRSVAFINIVEQNDGITGVGIVFINPLTFIIEDHDFMYTEQSPSHPIRFLELIKKYLDKKTWVYHSSITYLTNKFRYFIDDPPTATCKIDTTKWFEENFVNKINDMSLPGLAEHYKVNVEEIKEACTKCEVDLNLLDNFVLVAVLKAALGRKGLNDLLTKERSKKQETKRKREEEKETDDRRKRQINLKDL